MFRLTAIGLLACVSVAQCQRYLGGGGGGGDGSDGSNLISYRPQEPQQDYNQYANTPPPPQILSHKQALNHDGQFKYLFNTENGLAQGESISPDGTRNGGYSYTDPTGRKITVKYTAGKEGFRILEADHLPKAPQPVAPLPVPQHQTQASYAGPQSFQRQDDDGQYKPALYERPSPQALQTVPRYLQAVHGGQPQPRAAYPQPIAARPEPTSNSLNEREPDYNDAPGKPYSFGTGYIFEFSG